MADDLDLAAPVESHITDDDVAVDIPVNADFSAALGLLERLSTAVGAEKVTRIELAIDGKGVGRLLFMATPQPQQVSSGSRTVRLTSNGNGTGSRHHD